MDSDGRYSWWGKWRTPEGRRWLGWILFERFIRLLPYPNWRSFFLKWGGAKIGKRCFVHDTVFQNVYVAGFKHLHLGDNATIQTQCLIDLADRIILEDDVTVSAGVAIFTHEDCGAKLGKPLAEFFPPKRARVWLKKGSWIGARSTLLAGVTVGTCAVVGAASLVIEDVPDWTVVAGVPAREIRKIRKAAVHESKREAAI